MISTLSRSPKLLTISRYLRIHIRKTVKELLEDSKYPSTLMTGNTIRFSIIKKVKLVGLMRCEKFKFYCHRTGNK